MIRYVGMWEWLEWEWQKVKMECVIGTVKIIWMINVVGKYIGKYIIYWEKENKGKKIGVKKVSVPSWVLRLKNRKIEWMIGCEWILCLMFKCLATWHSIPVEISTSV